MTELKFDCLRQSGKTTWAMNKLERHSTWVLLEPTQASANYAREKGGSAKIKDRILSLGNWEKLVGSNKPEVLIIDEWNYMDSEELKKMIRMLRPKYVIKIGTKYERGIKHVQVYDLDKYLKRAGVVNK